MAIAADTPVRPAPPAGVLTGPAHADNFRVSVGRYGDRWYIDPLDADDAWPTTDATFPSVTTIKKASGSDWSYVSLGRVASAPAKRLVDIASYPPAERLDAFNSINKHGLGRAAQRGTNVHLMAEGILYGTGDAVGADAPGAEYRPAVEAFFTDHAPTLVAAEFVCVHRNLNGFGYAGTADAIVDIGGDLYVVDWKSRGEDSRHGAYPEEAAQVAAYARADYMLVEGDRGVERRPLPELAGGLIVSIKPDGYRVYPIDLDVAFTHWTALHAWWVARRDERAAIGRQWAVKKNTSAPAPDVTPPESAAPASTAPAPVAPTPADQQAAVRARPTPEDGAAVDDPTFDVLQAHYLALPAEGRAWITALTSQAQQASVPFHTKGHRTRRRYEIVRALVHIAADSIDDATEDTTRTFLEAVIGDVAQFPSVPLGHLIGSLSATEAATFAGLVDGTYLLAFTDAGKPTLFRAA